MGNLARRLERQGNQQQQIQVPIKKHVKKRRISTGEKALLVLFCAVFFIAAVKVITYQASIYEVKKDIQQLELSIDDIHKENGDLAIQVNELSTYERIWEKAAELGLLLNENNVKVVQE